MAKTNSFHEFLGLRRAPLPLHLRLAQTDYSRPEGPNGRLSRKLQESDRALKMRCQMPLWLHRLKRPTLLQLPNTSVKVPPGRTRPHDPQYRLYKQAIVAARRPARARSSPMMCCDIRSHRSSRRIRRSRIPKAAKRQPCIMFRLTTESLESTPLGLWPSASVYSLSRGLALRILVSPSSSRKRSLVNCLAPECPRSAAAILQVAMW